MQRKSTAILEKMLQAYRSFAITTTITSCRLVHYCGVDQPNAADVPLDEIEDQILGCIREGLFVDWHCREKRLYLCVQEPGCPIPEWSTVVSEAAIADVDEILMGAGFHHPPV